MVGYRIGHEGLPRAHSETGLIWRQQHIEITELAVGSVPKAARRPFGRRMSAIKVKRTHRAGDRIGTLKQDKKSHKC